LNAAAALLLAATLAATGTAGEHLLAGARDFREGRYGDALVEFRVADALGAEGARAYVAASLVNLERFEEALEAFEGVPRGEDALLDFYRALACYGAHLYACADEILGTIGDRGGPKIAAEVDHLRREIATRRGRQPTGDVVAWYSARCADLRVAKRVALAGAYCRESVALDARRAEVSKSSVRVSSPPESTRGAQ
jgi:hypothetical protein